MVKGSIILITGGAGFVGSHLADKLLLKKPKKIIIIDNMLRGTNHNIKNLLYNSKVEIHKADIRNFEVLEKLISRSDYIFHLAALRINRCAEDQQQAFEVMISATHQLIELAKKHDIKKIIYSSSASIYGFAQNFPTPETDHPYDNKTYYGVCKLFGEGLLRSYYDMYGLNYVALRYFNIYGPRMDTEGRYTEVMIKWLDCISEKRQPLIYGDGLTSMDFVYVDDVIDANIQALETEVTDQVFNVGFQRETNLIELLKMLLKVTNSELKPSHVDENTINPVSKRISDNKKINKQLGFYPKVSLEKGLLLLYNWYLEIKNKS